jgi:hypothetical protein
MWEGADAHNGGASGMGPAAPPPEKLRVEQQYGVWHVRAPTA